MSSWLLETEENMDVWVLSSLTLYSMVLALRGKRKGERGRKGRERKEERET